MIPINNQFTGKLMKCLRGIHVYRVLKTNTQLDTLTIEYTRMHDSLTKPSEIDGKIQSVKIKRPTAPRPCKN